MNQLPSEERTIATLDLNSDKVAATRYVLIVTNGLRLFAQSVCT